MSVRGFSHSSGGSIVVAMVGKTSHDFLSSLLSLTNPVSLSSLYPPNLVHVVSLRGFSCSSAGLFLPIFDHLTVIDGSDHDEMHVLTPLALRF